MSCQTKYLAMMCTAYTDMMASLVYNWTHLGQVFPQVTVEFHTYVLYTTIILGASERNN